MNQKPATRILNRSISVILLMSLLFLNLRVTGVGAAPAEHEQNVRLSTNILSQALISDSLFLYASTVVDFDTQDFLNQQNGPLGSYSEVIDQQVWSAADTIEYNAIFYGINPQVILVLLEAEDNLITHASSPVPTRPSPINQTEGLPKFFYHVKWLVETAPLSFGLRKNHEDNGKIVFDSGETIPVSPDLNAGTYGLQVLLAKALPVDRWTSWATDKNPLFIQRYANWFGDPLFDPDVLEVNDLHGNALAIPGGYNLPFPVGSTWYYTGGPHTYTGSGARPWSSVDLAPPEVTGCSSGSTTYNAGRWIAASRGGTVIASQTALVVIDHGDGWRTYYSHVSSTDRRGMGGINQNDNVGHPSCEVEPGGSTSGIHVHFAIYQVGTGFVNISGSSLSGWVVGETSHYNGTMTRQGVTRTATTGRYNGTNDIYNSGSGGACPGPSLNNPLDGYISSGQTISFSWSALSGCTFNGYTFRIKDTSNMDSGGNTIRDTGEGGTSRTETIGSEWNNRDLWWGVRAANAPNGASWSVRKFRIQPGVNCNINGDQVALFVDPNYSGACVVKGIGNYSNPSSLGIANDSVSSVKVGGNVKLTLCRDDNYAGGCETFQGDDSDLSNNSIGNDQVSSAKVESRGGPPSGYTWCADEDGTCTFPGRANVAFGANGQFTYKNDVSLSILCKAESFNNIDPIQGTRKACYYQTVNNSWAYQLYDLGDYNGERYESNQTINDLSSVGKNDWAESIKVNNGYGIIACSDANFTGSCGRATGPAQLGDINSLASGLRNGISSIKVCSGSCPNPPSANFDAWPLSGSAPFTSTMHIVDMSNITSCSWNYGDGQTSSTCTQTHDHTYQNAGTFTVSLTVSGPGGSNSMTRVNYITVNSPSYTLTVNKTGAGSGTVTSNPAGINCGSDCSESYANNNQVTLTAAPASGSVFTGWSGACSGTGVCTVFMTANRTVTANFTSNQLPDLIVQSITASPPHPAPNQPVTFTVRIKNQGTASISSNFYIDFYIDDQPVTDCSDIGTTWWATNSLAAGEARDLTYDYSGFSESGSHTLYAFADTNCDISESNDNNNILGPVTLNVQEKAFAPISQWTTDFNYSAQGWRVDKHPRMLADVNGDGKDDVVGFFDDGVWVGLSNGSGFSAKTKWTTGFSYNQGWRTDQHPRMLGDVNGDGRADIVGFGYEGAWIALSNGSSFGSASKWTANFNYNQGWRVAQHPRTVADVNGDGKDDLIGFGYEGVWVTLSTGSGFGPISKWTSNFNYNQGWRVEQHPRMAADVNGDGKADLIGFGNTGVWITLSTGSGFGPTSMWTGDFNYAIQGWRVEQHPRTAADVNGDGKADLIGFGYYGVWIALSTGSGFEPIEMMTEDFNYSIQGWRVEKHPRMAGDVNADGKADLIGFGDYGVWVTTAR